MSHNVPCSCRLPWLAAAACAVAGGAALALPCPAPPATAAPAAPVDARLAEARHEVEELRRVYNDAQSALAQRDREIAAAEDDLRALRKELETLRGKPASTP